MKCHEVPGLVGELLCLSSQHSQQELLPLAVVTETQSVEALEDLVDVIELGQATHLVKQHLQTETVRSVA